MHFSNHPAVVVFGVAVVASLLAELRVGSFRVPVVIWEMLFGILIGPQVLGLVTPGHTLLWLGDTLGLAALFFMAGMDLDLEKVKGRPLKLAFPGWLISLGIAVAAAALLHSLRFVHTTMLVALVLTTTAMGTFMPMLRDEGLISTSFGSYVIGAGAAGEFLPVMVVSLVLTRHYGAGKEVALVLCFIAVAVGAAAVAIGVRPPKVLLLLERTMHSSTQLPVLLSLLLLSIFDFLCVRIGLESVLGAFAAGMVVGLASQDEEAKPFRAKMDAVCFGFLIPFFFVVSGMNLDLGALLNDRKSVLMVPLFLLLFLIVRGVPVFLYRNDIAKNQRLPFVLYSGTALPLVVAITNIGVRTGQLRSDMAASLVGAGVLSVLLFPTVAGTLLARNTALAPTAK